MVRYNDIYGNEIILSEKFGHGGEADVYTILGCNNLLAKIYNDKHLIDSQKLQKLEKMCAMYDDEIAKYYAWPQQIIYSENKAVGFLMENINYNNKNGSKYIKFVKFYSWKDRRRYFPNADYKFLIDAAINLTITIEFLHKKGIIVGDINESNIFVNNTDATIKLIDCDSYQIDNYLCDVGIPAYTAPELPNKLRGEIRTKHHDYFSLAIVIFLILAGKHPYMGINTSLDKIRQSIIDGLYCYGKNAENKNISPLYPYSEIYDSFSNKIKNLFEQAFTMTIRPSTKAWRNALETYKSKLKPCKKDKHHFYYPKYKACLWCDIEEYGYYAFIPAPIQRKNNFFIFLVTVIIILAAIFCFVFKNDKENQQKQFPIPTQSVQKEEKNSVTTPYTQRNHKNNGQVRKTNNIVPQTNKPKKANKQTEPKPKIQPKVQAKPKLKTQKTTVSQKQKPAKNENISQKTAKTTPPQKKIQTEIQPVMPAVSEKPKKYKYNMQKSIDDFYKGAD